MSDCLGHRVVSRAIASPVVAVSATGAFRHPGLEQDATRSVSHDSPSGDMALYKQLILDS